MQLTTLLFCKKAIQSAILRTEKEFKISVPWGRLTGLSWGSSSLPPVLFCHGQIDTCSSFRPLVSLMPEEYFYVSIDLPGNGKSDRLPPGARLSAMDLVPSIGKVKNHFGWDKFTFIGHSLGCHLGMYYISAYPGIVTRSIHLDPRMPPTVFGIDIRTWYLNYYGKFYKNYERLNAGVESAPRYRYEEIREKMKTARSLTDEAVEHVLERCLVPAGDGLYRLSFDQRFRDIMMLPFTKEQYEQIWTSSKTPLLSITTSQSISDGHFNFSPYIIDNTEWPNKNHRHLTVEEVHDVHLNKPAVVIDYVRDFLKGTRVD
ncbi:serine hydrolase-like protein [Ostrinia furnacalis]|uniref:serine hydrolase-like protein n=1 Tax=Ostrinia furnacalis TaxID=93504 RepID=UPI001040DA2F|nr:serine hydrolase-like protein [Ostrinia furnacalis]